jgi:hypothetical protein
MRAQIDRVAIFVLCDVANRVDHLGWQGRELPGSGKRRHGSSLV